MVSIYNPRQVVFVTISGRAEVLGVEKEVDEIVVVNAHSPANRDPGIYAIFVSKEYEHALKLLENGSTFVVNFVPESIRDKVMKITPQSHVDKFELSGLGKEPVEKTDSVRISEAVGHIECQMVKYEDLGDHVMILGKILNGELLDGASKRLIEEN